MRRLSAICAVLIGTAVAGAAAESFKSGLQPGEKVTMFQVIDITGPNRGKTFCYI